MAAATLAGPSGRLTIDLGAIVKNWRALDAISAQSLTAAVVKGDAYGVGLIPAGIALYNAGARFFFVATPDEGISLRGELPDAHIFVLNGLLPGSAKLLEQYKLMPVLNSLGMLEEWLEHCLAANEAFPAALHFDTGMNRLGMRMHEAEIVRSRLEEFGYLPQMVMSHLACADQPNHEKNRTQLALFQSVITQFSGIPASLANSAGMLISRENHFQMVRPGVAIYGGRAVSGRKNPMAPVVKLEVPVLQVHEARTGETVGYGAGYTLDRESRIAILAIGYADGFLRSHSSTNMRQGGRAVFKNRILPVIGKVSMDLIAIDVTDLGDACPRPGDMVEILGRTITVDNQADLAGTIGYEILTSLKGRYKRTYISPKAEQNS
jgi:alanine racemase